MTIERLKPKNDKVGVSEEVVCQGTIIASRWVLTSCECLEHGVDLSQYIVRAGSNVEMNIMQFKPHFECRKSLISINKPRGIRRNNVAVIQVREPFLFGHAINMIRVLSKFDLYYGDFSLPEDLEDFGKLHTFGYDNRLRSQNQHRIVEYNECEEIYADVGLKLFPEYFCSIPQSGSSPMMKKQLGASLIIDSPRGQRLVGILAYYPDEPWSSQLPGIYTNVTENYATWIDDKIKLNLAAGSCEACPIYPDQELTCKAVTPAVPPQ